MKNIYEINAIVTGQIVEIAPYGAFVECEEGKKGLLHISEISSHYVSDINELLKLGQTISVKIISIDAGNGYMRFSLKQVPIARATKVRTRVRVKLPTEEINFIPLREALPEWIRIALEETNEE